MSFPWGILIAAVVLGLALLIKYLASEVVEEDHHFWGVIGIFLAIYAAAAVGIAFVSPHYTAVARSEPVTEAVSLDSP